MKGRAEELASSEADWQQTRDKRNFHAARIYSRVAQNSNGSLFLSRHPQGSHSTGRQFDSQP
jgi:hypothetical protein